MVRTVDIIFLADVLFFRKSCSCCIFLYKIIAWHYYKNIIQSSEEEMAMAEGL